MDAMTARCQAAPDRLTGALDETLGPAPIPSYLQRDIRANQKAIGPEYEQLFAGAQAVDTAPLAQAIEATIPTLRGKAQSELQAVQEMLNRTGTKDLDASPVTLFQVRRAIDGVLQSETDRNVTRVLGETRADVDALLASAVPGIKQLDARYAELARQNDAVERGQTVLGSGRSDPRPAELIDETAAGVIPQGEIVGPSGVTFRVRQGARAEIDRLVGTNLNDRAALNSLLKGESDWNRARLTTLFGRERVDRLYRILEGERAMAETENRAFAGSKTASLQAAQQEIDGPPAGAANPVRSLMDLRAGTAAADAFGAVSRRIGGRRRESANEDIARALMSGGEFIPRGPYRELLPAPLSLPLEIIEAIMREDR